MATYLVTSESDSQRIPLMVAAIALASMTSIVFSLLPRRVEGGRRWVTEALLALLASLAGFAIQSFPAVLAKVDARPLADASFRQAAICLGLPSITLGLKRHAGPPGTGAFHHAGWAAANPGPYVNREVDPR